MAIRSDKCNDQENNIYDAHEEQLDSCSDSINTTDDTNNSNNTVNIPNRAVKRGRGRKSMVNESNCQHKESSSIYVSSKIQNNSFTNSTQHNKFNYNIIAAPQRQGISNPIAENSGKISHMVELNKSTNTSTSKTPNNPQFTKMNTRSSSNLSNNNPINGNLCIRNGSSESCSNVPIINQSHISSNDQTNNTMQRHMNAKSVPLERLPTELLIPTMPPSQGQTRSEIQHPNYINSSKAPHIMRSLINLHSAPMQQSLHNYLSSQQQQNELPQEEEESEESSSDDGDSLRITHCNPSRQGHKRNLESIRFTNLRAMNMAEAEANDLHFWHRTRREWRPSIKRNFSSLLESEEYEIYNSRRSRISLDFRDIQDPFYSSKKNRKPRQINPDAYRPAKQTLQGFADSIINLNDDMYHSDLVYKTDLFRTSNITDRMLYVQQSGNLIDDHYHVKNYSIEQLNKMDIKTAIQIIDKITVKPLLRLVDEVISTEYRSKPIPFLPTYTLVRYFGDKQTCATQLYAFYKITLSNWCKKHIEEIKNENSILLVRSAARVWQKYSAIVFSLQKRFIHLDHYFSLTNSDFPKLFTQAVILFQKYIYEKMASQLSKQIINAIQLFREKNFENDPTLSLDAQAVRVTMCMIGAMGETEVCICRSPTDATSLKWDVIDNDGLYKDDFQKPLVEASIKYYQMVTAKNLNSMSCYEYLNFANELIKNERKICEEVILLRTRQMLFDVVCCELIQKIGKTLVENSTGLRFLLKENKLDEIRLMFDVYKLNNCLHFIAAEFKNYVSSYIQEIVENPINLESAEKYVEELILADEYFNSIAEKCMQSNELILQNKIQGIEETINKDNICVKHLASYCDSMLKNIINKKIFSSPDKFNAIFALFYYLKNKEVFMELYKKYLSKRLLSEKSISITDECNFFDKIKDGVYLQTSSSISSMLEDVLMWNYINNNFINEHEIKDISFNVKILQSNSWPEESVDNNIIQIPQKMIAPIALFEKYYHKLIGTGRKLDWVFTHGVAELEFKWENKIYTIHTSTYGAIILLIFNKEQSYTAQQIAELTGIDQSEVTRHLQSFCILNQSILINNNQKIINNELPSIQNSNTSIDTYLINNNFTHNNSYIKIKLIEKKANVEQDVIEDSPIDKKHSIDAFIVRLLKAKKRMNNKEIMAEMCKQNALYKTMGNQIKAQLENLIKREFVGRDPKNKNYYVYLP